MTGVDLDPAGILYGSERVTTISAAATVAVDAREVFVQLLHDLTGAMPQPQSAEDCTGVLQQTFEAAAVYVRQAGAFPMDDPNNVHRLLENADLDPDLEDFSFLEGMVFPVQECCYHVKSAEERIWATNCTPDSTVARLRSVAMRSVLPSPSYNKMLQAIEEYLEAVYHQIHIGTTASR
jgi:hypothetical protein